jgi:hypothetical protein
MESPIIGIVLFVFLIFAVAQLTMITGNNLDRVKVSIDSNVQRNIEEGATMNIVSINCSMSADLNTTNIIIENTGDLKLHIDEIDVYQVLRFPRNETNRTIEIISDTDFLDPGLWNRKERVNITLYMQMIPDFINIFTISNEYGVSVAANCNSTWP